MKFTTLLFATALTFAITACTQLQEAASKAAAWAKTTSSEPAIKALETEASSLLKTFVFKAGASKLAGANWADSAAAGIYAAQDQLAADPSALTGLLGGYLPADSTWTPVVNGLVSKLVSGGLNTKAERIAALQAIAATLNTTAAAQRTQ